MRLGKAAFEYKLDGARIQLHKQGTEVRIFTRHLNEVTAAVPEIAQAIRDVAARSLILDGEALGVQGDGTPQPFQVTMRRFGRKLDVDRLRRSIPCVPSSSTVFTRTAKPFSTAQTRSGLRRSPARCRRAC